MNLQQLYRYLSLDALHVTWTDVAEIIILSFIIYQILIWIKTTRAWSLLNGFSVIMALLGRCRDFSYEYHSVDCEELLQPWYYGGHRRISARTASGAGTAG